MDSAKTLDKKITNYLLKLNTRQKEAVLTVIKTFAEEQDIWEDEEFLSMLDKRASEFEEGKAKVFTLAEVQAKARKFHLNKIAKSK
jgi:predicted deacetylase